MLTRSLILLILINVAGLIFILLFEGNNLWFLALLFALVCITMFKLLA
jgi:hypothetical protein